MVRYTYRVLIVGFRWSSQPADALVGGQPGPAHVSRVQQHSCGSDLHPDRGPDAGFTLDLETAPRAGVQHVEVPLVGQPQHVGPVGEVVPQAVLVRLVVRQNVLVVVPEQDRCPRLEDDLSCLVIGDITYRIPTSGRRSPRSPPWHTLSLRHNVGIMNCQPPTGLTS